MEEKKVICASCDIACSVVAQVEKGQVVKIRSSDNPIFKDNICMKGIFAPKGFAHPERVRYPLRRVGERGSGEWERVSWDSALDDIGTRLRGVIDTYGPEAWAVSTSQMKTKTNGSISAVSLLMGPSPSRKTPVTPSRLRASPLPLSSSNSLPGCKRARPSP